MFQNRFFKEQVKVRSKIEGKEQRFATCPCPHTGIASPVITSLTRIVLLFQLMNLPRHTVTHPKSTLHLRTHAMALGEGVGHLPIIPAS